MVSFENPMLPCAEVIAFTGFSGFTGFDLEVKVTDSHSRYFVDAPALLI